MNLQRLSLFSCVMILGLLCLATWSCGDGGGNGEDAEQDQEVPPDGTDGDTQVDPRPDDAAQPDADAGEDAPPVDGTEDVAQDVPVDDAAPEDTAEEDAAEEEVPVVPPVDCDGVECLATEECCFTTGPSELNCVDIGACTGGVLECDEGADCPSGWICCHQPPDDTGATCVETCDDRIVCGDASECPEAEPYCCEAMGGVFMICRANPC